MATDTPAKLTESCPFDHLGITLNIMGPYHFSSLSVAHFSQGRYGIQTAATFTLFKAGMVSIHCGSSRDLSSGGKLSCHIGRMLSSGQSRGGLSSGGRLSCASGRSLGNRTSQKGLGSGSSSCGDNISRRNESLPMLS